MELFYLIVLFLIGTVFGSFYGVVGMRLARDESLIKPGSHCEVCHHPLKVGDLLPIISYLKAKGRCRYCGAKLPVTYLFLEVITGILFSLSYYCFSFTPSFFLALILSSLFSIILASDLHYYIIPDEVLITSGVLLTIVQLFRLGIKETAFYLLNGVFLFGIMYLIMLLGNKLFKKESLGGGDIKLMFLVGLVLHPILGIFSIFLASLIALPVSYFLLKKNEERLIPFGPFIMVAVLLLFFSKVDPANLFFFLGL